jgi:hypothetical protein
MEGRRNHDVDNSEAVTTMKYTSMYPTYVRASCMRTVPLLRVPVHLRAAQATVRFSADQSILMQRHVASRSGAICRYADGLVRAKIDANGCDERVRRQQS